jgi:hypothetical protein
MKPQRPSPNRKLNWKMSFSGGPELV